MEKDEALVINLQERLKEGPQPGERWQHYKGGFYTIICRSVDEDRLVPLVTYRSEERGSTWTRTIDNWNEMVDGAPRFLKIWPKDAP